METITSPQLLPKKFWDCSSSGRATINEFRLYQYLHQKGYRYFQTSAKDPIFILLVRENTVSVLIYKLYRLCCTLVDQDFGSLSEDERYRVKEALTEVKNSLKKKNLSFFKSEDLDVIIDSPSKQFLMRQNMKHLGEKGGVEI
jgi:hypothetical protein